MSVDALKKAVAEATLAYIPEDCVVGVGTGSTVNYFIEALASMKHRIEGAVASSAQTRDRLRAQQIPVLDLNTVNELPVYIDGADEFTSHGYLLKGGGGALTQEKIIAAVAKQFICIADHHKAVDVLGAFPLPIEVIPCARSYVAREMLKLGGDPVYRDGFVTDNGNVILDIHHLSITNPIQLEYRINQIAGVVTNGIFANRRADIVLFAHPDRIETLKN